MFDLYKNIENLALEHGFKNVTELCRVSGVPRSNLSEIKMGRSKDISKPNAQKLADAMGVSLDVIYGNETKKEPADELVYMSANRQAAVYELFAEKMEETCETPANVIARSGVKKDFFPRLKNFTLSRVERADLDKVAAYLGVSQELEDILSAEDEESESIKEIMSKIHLIPKDKRKLVNDWLDTIITR